MSINIIHKAFNTTHRKEPECGRHDTSPVKTVLGSLNTPSQTAEVPLSKERQQAGDHLNIKVPKSIEEVPFRRQDIRILIAKNRRMMDRKLILFLVTCGLLMMMLGLGLVLAYISFQHQHQHIRPLIVIGPVLIGASFFTIMFSIEICIRLRTSLKRIQDRDIDNNSNPHEVKHWMDPKLIPYGWGMFEGLNNGDEPKIRGQPPRILIISPSELHSLTD